MQERRIGTDQNKRLGGLQKVLLALVLLAGFAIRIYDLQDPPLDFSCSPPASFSFDLQGGLLPA